MPEALQYLVANTIYTPGDAARVLASDACRVHYRLTRNECTIDGLVTSALWTDS